VVDGPIHCHPALAEPWGRMTECDMYGQNSLRTDGDFCHQKSPRAGLSKQTDMTKKKKKKITINPKALEEHFLMVTINFFIFGGKIHFLNFSQKTSVLKEFKDDYPLSLIIYKAYIQGIPYCKITSETADNEPVLTSQPCPIVNKTLTNPHE
jgi:hypothetical protein